jgi:hypothetical protein
MIKLVGVVKRSFGAKNVNKQLSDSDHLRVTGFQIFRFNFFFVCLCGGATISMKIDLILHLLESHIVTI